LSTPKNQLETGRELTILWRCRAEHAPGWADLRRARFPHLQL